ncbi:hypothetical protein PTSG_06951 [Salpingoeca rosetta]|uniref:Coiled-coil domain-containing protein 47 n=1 Tax=Salpingoeca rosetta (strain ATCC 50818 / BSB-021) TaxID=946362 RepID=F2UF99_SALR5|nr:uncharacterized protein PTSG_06951 [Salpingoeca rosetta]EGD75299.1 hypothetical protein PTSG_06951 [Salpingoeca rosetta]|eukprot:XP_004992352.1 hypothetical protein PTSG_06951 [Salpingoeca rosetta]
MRAAVWWKKALVVVLVALLVGGVGGAMNGAHAAEEDEFDEDEFTSPGAGVAVPSPPKAATDIADDGASVPLEDAAPGDADEEEFDSASEFRVVGIPRTAVNSLDDDFDEEEFEAVLVDEPVQQQGAAGRGDSKVAGSHDDDEEVDDDDIDGDVKLDLSVEAKAAARLSNRPLDIREYYLEIVGLVVLLGFLVFYLHGRSENKRVVEAVAESVLERMKERFAHIGDETSKPIIAEAANEFVLYGTGNRRCFSFKAEFVLKRRQDAIGLVLDTATGQQDTLVVSAQLDGKQVDPFVLAVTTPLFEPELRSDNEDIAFLTKKGPQLFETLNVVCDSQGAATSILSGSVLTRIKAIEDYLVHLKMTDQYRTQKVRRPGDWPNNDLKLQKPINAMTMHLSVDLTREADRAAAVTAIELGMDLLEAMATYKMSSQDKTRAKKLRDDFTSLIQKEISKQEAQAVQARVEERKQKERERLEANPQELAKWEEKQRKRQQRKQAKQGRIMIK